jgi:hypothetical protein
VAVFDAGDVYTAGLKYDLIPFISEVYNLGQPEYYAVAVAKEEDPDTELTYLKGISSFFVHLLLDEQHSQNRNCSRSYLTLASLPSTSQLEDLI